MSLATTGRPAAIVAIVLGALLAAALVFRSTGWQTAALGLPALLIFALGSYALLRFGQLFVSPVGPALSFLFVVSGQAALDYSAERRSRCLCEAGRDADAQGSGYELKQCPTAGFVQLVKPTRELSG